MTKYLGNIVSWSAFIINISGIILIINGIVEIRSIFFFVMLAAILDLFDGKLARKFITDQKDFLFGELTDSLCDTINFGIIPIFTFLYFFNQYIFLSIFISSFYLWCVVFRLARFSRDKTEVKVKYYTGLPVTVSGPISVFITLILSKYILLVSFLQILLGIFMICNIKIKKL